MNSEAVLNMALLYGRWNWYIWWGIGTWVVLIRVPGVLGDVYSTMMVQENSVTRRTGVQTLGYIDCCGLDPCQARGSLLPPAPHHYYQHYYYHLHHYLTLNHQPPSSSITTTNTTTTYLYHHRLLLLLLPPPTTSKTTSYHHNHHPLPVQIGR